MTKKNITYINRVCWIFSMLLLIWCCFFVEQAVATPSPQSYENAKVELGRLLEDKSRAKYRHNWQKLAESFLEAYEDNSKWGNRAAALYRSALSLEEMARRSFVPKDAQEAASRYERLARSHPGSVLADDSLFRAALVRNELLHDEADAKALLQQIQKKYAKGDHVEKAVQYMARLSGSQVASLEKAPSILAKMPGTEITGISAKMSGKAVRIVLSLQNNVSWRISHLQMEDGQQLRVALKGSSLKSGLASQESFRGLGPLVEYTASSSSSDTELMLNFTSLVHYKVRVEKSPFRIILEATDKPGVLSGGFDVAAGKKTTAAKAQKPVVPASTPAKASPKAPPLAPKEKLQVMQMPAAQLGLQVRTIVIDAGHGGKDPGTVHNNLKEHDITLDIAKRVGKRLSAKGYTVVYTREKNSSVALVDRPKIASKNQGDLFVSIHVNASKTTEASGIETYILDMNASNRDAAMLAMLENAPSTRSLGELNKILADIMVRTRVQESKDLAKAVQSAMVGNVRKQSHKVHDGGVKGAPFHVLMGTSMPSILVEVGYSSNKAEAQKLSQQSYRNILAQGIAVGIMDYADKIKYAAQR